MLPGKVKEFFLRNMGAKILSILIAFVLWTVVIGSRTVEVDKKVPIEILTPANMLVVNDPPKEVTFRLSGPKTFLRVVLDRREEPIKVDLSRQKPGLVTYRFFSDSIRVPIGVKVLSNNPTAVLIKLEEVKYRKLPVKVELAGIAPEGYDIVKTEVVPAEVIVRGAQSRIEKLSTVSTLPIDISRLKSDYEKEAVLDLIRHKLELEGDPPLVKLKVQPVVANYRIRNVKIRVRSTYRSKLSEESVTVFVRALPEDLETLDQSKVYAEIDLTGKEKGKYTASINIVVPENIGLVKVEPEQVEVTLH